MEYMIVDWNSDIKEQDSFFAKTLWDIFKKEQNKGFSESWDFFQQIVRKHDLKNNKYLRIKNKDLLKEFDIISVPTKAVHEKKTEIKKEKKERNDFIDGIQNGYYVYSKNYGWIDMGHAGLLGGSKKIKKMYEQIQSAKKNDVISFEMSSGKNNILGIPNFNIKVNVSKVKIKILADSLTEEEAKSITLSVFKQTSINFEKSQKKTDFIKQSSFAEEDLPSNILNYYVELFSFSKEKIFSLTNVLPMELSLWIYNRYAFQKNYTFEPIILIPGGEKPKIFDSVEEIPEGKLWQNI